MEISAAYYLTILIMGTGLVIKSCEILVTINDYDSRRIFDWNIVGSDKLLYSRLTRLFGSVYSKSGVTAICGLTIASFLLMISVRFESILFYIGLSVLAIANLVLYFRQGYGLDGADQMIMLILLTLLTCFVVVDDQQIREIGLWFIALQLALSYIVSGLAKLVSKQWRSGVATQGILSTYTYGTWLTRKFLTSGSASSINRLLCWMVILIESLFVLTLFLDPSILFWCLIGGLLFHLSIAVVMGLNDFVWSFAAAYPAYYYISQFC